MNNLVNDCGLLLIERAILECMAEGAKTIEQIHQETSIRPSICIKVLQSFLEREIILQQGLSYSINFSQKSKLGDSFGNTDALIEEVEELLHCLLKKKFKKQVDQSDGEVDFSLKKIDLDEKDYKILKTYFYSINQFIKNLSSQKVKSPKAQKRVIFWGEGLYQSIIQESLSV